MKPDDVHNYDELFSQVIDRLQRVEAALGRIESNTDSIINRARNRHPKHWLKEKLKPRLFSLTHHDPRPLHTKRFSAVTIKGLPPSIVIVTPSYNHGHFIEKTIAS